MTGVQTCALPISLDTAGAPPPPAPATPQALANPPRASFGCGAGTAQPGPFIPGMPPLAAQGPGSELHAGAFPGCRRPDKGGSGAGAPRGGARAAPNFLPRPAAGQRHTGGHRGPSPRGAWPGSGVQPRPGLGGPSRGEPRGDPRGGAPDGGHSPWRPTISATCSELGTGTHSVMFTLFLRLPITLICSASSVGGPRAAGWGAKPANTSGGDGRGEIGRAHV